MKVNLKWDTDIRDLSKQDIHALVWETFRYCRKVLKMEPRGRVYPSLHIYPRKSSDAYGEYSPYLHLVEIYSSECDTLRRLIDTVIHEYTHSCQRWLTSRYFSLGYNKNPFEVEARRVARENRTSCIKHLQKVFND